MKKRKKLKKLKQKESLKQLTNKKSVLGKIWYFLWEENSLISWIACIALCFLFIQLIFFPLFSLIFSSNRPFVIVESGSMEHKGDFDIWWRDYGDWYENRNITKEIFSEFPLKNGFNEGDIMAVMGIEEYKIGEVIVFERDSGNPIIHRIISTDPLQTKGDHNSGQIEEDTSINEDKIIGKAIFRIPLLGKLKLAVVNFLGLR